MHPNLIQAARKLLNSPNRFASDDILNDIPNMTESELDMLPFGVIGLDDKGFVLQYNEYETKLANRSRAETIGKAFFKEVAPCTNSPIFSGIFFEGVKQKNLQAFVSYFFDFKMTPTHVWIHMHRCTKSQSNWILVQKKKMTEQQ